LRKSVAGWPPRNKWFMGAGAIVTIKRHLDKLRARCVTSE
jgi:hypothetical protein